MKIPIAWLQLLCVIPALAAQQAAPQPSFEVASIKPTDPSARQPYSGGPGTASPGQMTLRNYSVEMLIRRAFDLHNPWEMALPNSLPTDRYDIVAKAPPGAAADDALSMLQNLLVERFGMVAHKETREMPIYELVVAKDGPRFKPVEKAPDGPVQPIRIGQYSPPRIDMSALPKDKDGWPILPPDAVGMFGTSIRPYSRTMFRAQPIATLIERLRLGLDRPVVDKTGLKGIYNYDWTVLNVEAISEEARSAAPGSPERNAALREQDGQLASNILAGIERMGLKAIPTKGPFEVVVIDKVNKKPTEN